MANVAPMDLQAIQDSINTLINNDAETPDSGDDDWDTNQNLIYMAIRNWGVTQDILWNELWKTYTHGSTLSGTTTYTLTFTDYRMAGGSLRLVLNSVTSYVPFIDAAQAQQYIAASRKAAYITGNANAGYTLNLTWTPVAGDGTYGATVLFDYYKYPFKPELTTDEVEMSDPNYIVYWVAANKSLQDGKRNQYSIYDAQAEECLTNMKIMNDVLPDYQNNRVEDVDALAGAVMGE